MEQAFVSWSGGKDCCLAFHRASQNGYRVRYLLNMINEDGSRSRSHGLDSEWLKVQAEALGVSLLQCQTSRESYEGVFTGALQTLRAEGITTGVFGDIDFNEHRAWIERVCQAGQITPYLPLWLEDQTVLMEEFIGQGFEAIVVAVRADVLGKEWLGRKVDLQFLADLAKLGNVTPCGESGEFHTFVVDGPLFRQRVEITPAGASLREGRWFLNIAHSQLSKAGNH